MKVWELSLKVYVKKDIEMEDSQNEISKLIDSCLSENQELLSFHKENKYKNYTFSSFYPLEKNKIYQSGKIYTVTIRTIEEKIAKHFKQFLDRQGNETLKAIVVDMKIIPKRHIEKIYSLTPVVAKFETGYWRTNENIDSFEKRLKENIIKKYNDYSNTKIDEDFEVFTFIKFDNRKPVATKYKEIRLLGDKLTLIISDNNLAQDLAYFALGVGLLEMNARGYGFVNYKWL